MKNMDFLTLSKERYSVRKFLDRKVEEEKINRILKAGQIAPTACNKQPQRIYLIESDEALEKWRKCTPCHFGETLVLLTCVNKTEEWKRDFDGKTSGDVDASIVMTHMMLEGWELGIGSTWVMYFIPEAVRVEFCLPDELEPIGALLMGYPAENVKPSSMHEKKKEISETVVRL